MIGFWKRKKQDTAGAACSPLLLSRWIEIRDDGKNGRKTVYLCRADRVVKYSDDEITVRMGKELVTVTGKTLFLSTYRNGSVEIAGRVESVSFRGTVL